jgi:hypothetical protein
MPDVVKGRLEINIKDARFVLHNRLGNPLHRLMSRPIRTVAIRPQAGNRLVE